MPNPEVKFAPTDAYICNLDTELDAVFANPSATTPNRGGGDGEDHHQAWSADEYAFYGAQSCVPEWKLEQPGIDPDPKGRYVRITRVAKSPNENGKHAVRAYDYRKGRLRVAEILLPSGSGLSSADIERRVAAAYQMVEPATDLQYMDFLAEMSSYEQR
jgi:hypothetical protein